MTQAVTINYRPIINNETSHVRKFTTTIDQLLGIMILANSLSSPHRITIELQGGGIADITQVNTLRNFGNNTNSFEYTAKLLDNDVSFNGLELIQGAIQLCLILGVDPSSVITNIQRYGVSVKINFERYFGIISLPNFTEYPDGSAILIEDTAVILSESLVDSLSKSLKECFPENEPAIIIPSEVYMITIDKTRSNIIASCVATLNAPQSIGQYANIGAYYIFNVCANTNIRGQGLAKSVMISMLNDLIGKGYNTFVLEVLPTNKVAYNLYESFGFQRVSSTNDGTDTYDLLYLKI